MTDSPADQLTAASHQLRTVGDHRLANELVRPIADLFDSAAADFEMCNRVNSRDPHNPGKTRIMPHSLAGAALAVARQILGQVTE